MDVNANNEREAREGEEVIFIDTGLLQKAAQGLQRAKEEFRALLDRAEDWLAGQGAALVECQVVEGNCPGAAFWARQGYAPSSATRAKVLPPKEAAHVVSPG